MRLKVDTAEAKEGALRARRFWAAQNRFGLRPTRFAPPKNKSQRNRERDKNPRETGHFLQYPSQKGISSSVMVLVLVLVLVAAGALEPAILSADAARRWPPPALSPAPLPSITISRARISVVFRLLPS